MFLRRSPVAEPRTTYPQRPVAPSDSRTTAATGRRGPSELTSLLGRTHAHSNDLLSWELKLDLLTVQEPALIKEIISMRPRLPGKPTLWHRDRYGYLTRRL